MNGFVSSRMRQISFYAVTKGHVSSLKSVVEAVENKSGQAEALLGGEVVGFRNKPGTIPRGLRNPK